MHKNGAVLRVPHVLENRQQLIQIVAIHRANVIKTQLFKQRSPCQVCSGVLDGAGNATVHAIAEVLGDFPALVAHGEIGFA